MKARKLKTLAKQYDFETEYQAAEYIYLSRSNGQHRQARTLFYDLEPQAKAEAITLLREGVENDGAVLEAVIDWIGFQPWK